MEGTYPLPEAQIDRFFFKLKMNYPDQKELLEIIDKTTEEYQPELKSVVGTEAIIEMKSLIKQVPIASHVKDYAIQLVMASHPDNELATPRINEFVLLGSSPRGVQSLILAGKVSALMDGRYNVSIEDINAVAKPALRHRIALNIRGETEGINTDDVFEEILRKVQT
jgi:MoxR-like ATPase